MDIKLEVGQVWKSIKTEKEWTVIDLFDVESVPYVAHKLMLDGVVVNVAFCTQSNFVNGVTLITTADGKPYVKPSDYRAGDVWDLGGDIVQKGAFTKTLLIYRDGKVITND